MQAFGDSLAAAGQLAAVVSLARLDGAVRVSHADGLPLLRDCPFAEAKEMIGGFFLLKNVTREQALLAARQCPQARWATVEVRPLAPCFMQDAR